MSILLKFVSSFFMVWMIILDASMAAKDPSCGIGRIPLNGSSNVDDGSGGSQEAQLGQIVWQASVETKSMFGSWKHSCGGVILQQQFVLTSASCVHSAFPGMLRSESGIIDLPKGGFVRSSSGSRSGSRSSGNFPGAQKPGLAYIESVSVHPDFDKKTFQNNLAVLRLAMPFDFEKSEGNISQICLPDTHALSGDGGDNQTTTLFVSGWGSGLGGSGTNLRPKLKYRSVRLIECPEDLELNSNEFCVTQQQQQPKSKPETEMMETTTTIDDVVETTTKTEDDDDDDKPEPEPDQCEGDLGGPLFTDNERFGSKLIGILSRTNDDGAGGCDDENPLIFLDIFPYLKWIEEASKPYVPTE